jgi:capsular polysaccharide biosynthesis protein
MESSISHILSKSKQTLFVGALIGVILAVGMSFFIPIQYRADGQVYIISHSRFGVDPYTVAKSAERIGENLAQVMKTNDFYEKVGQNGKFSLDKSYFENVTERTKRKRWEQTVDASVNYGTGILNVSAYHKNPEQAKAYAAALMDTLINRGTEYVGDDVSLKILNEPITSRLPVRPNFLVNALVGFAFGLLLMSVMVLRKEMKR